jgi:MazG family protein
VNEWWDEHKKKEGKNKKSLMDGVPRSLPALIRAREIQLKATKVGFDWDRIEDAFEKLEEEIREFKDALQKKKQAEIESEIGDVFFVLVRIANFANVNAEDALRNTIRKFIGRFEHIEREALNQGKKLSDMTLEEMDVLWEKAKGK